MDSRAAHAPFILLGSFCSVAAQIMLAPNIAVAGVVPNFLLVFTVIVAIFNNRTTSSVLGFILGLLYDLIIAGPIGVMPLVLSVLAFSVSSLNKDMFSGGWLVEVVLLLVAAFLGELLYAALLSIVGYDTNFLGSLVSRTLPGTVYDSLLGLIIFPVMNRFSRRRRQAITTLKGKLL
ncbi:MAG: rod shape-determining protein MreD [Coriobacteriales bacterium]|jgi:rod shape-determining protein MreD|nr:rod shape-determining protein MreD [Coriobacteriales bacterium]